MEPMTTPVEPPIIPIREAATIANVSEDTMRDWVRSGRVASVRVGTGTRRPQRRVVVADLRRILAGGESLSSL